MATIYFYLGKIEPLLEYPVEVFESYYENEWLNSELGRYIIKTIDSSEVIAGKAIDSPVLGVIPPEYLSCGCKSVLLAAFYDKAEELYFDGSKMGDNCYPVLFEVVRRTNRKIKVQVGRVLWEPWSEDDTVIFLPRNEEVKGYTDCFHYLGINARMFYRGDGYGSKS